MSLGQTLIAAFGKILRTLLQTVQDPPLARLHSLTYALHICRTSGLIPFRFLPTHHPLSDDLLARLRQPFHVLRDTTLSILSGQRIRADLLHLCVALHLCNLPGTAITRN